LESLRPYNSSLATYKALDLWVAEHALPSLHNDYYFATPSEMLGMEYTQVFSQKLGIGQTKKWGVVRTFVETTIHS